MHTYRIHKIKDKDMLEIKEHKDDYIPLRDIVFQKLREAIITGKMGPGDRLMEIKLANEMGVSRTPVREAIRKLETEGLVIMNARKGAVVAPINEGVMKEILEIRKALESLACQLVAAKAHPEDIQRLRDINAAMRKAIDEGDIETITERDVEFHETITALAANSHLTSMLDQIKEHLYRYRLEFIKELKNKYVLADEHDRLVDALETKNAKAAGREIEKHIELQERYIINTLEQVRQV